MPHSPFRTIAEVERRKRRELQRASRRRPLVDWWRNREPGKWIKKLGALAGIVLGGMFGTGWIGWVVAIILFALAGIIALKIL